MIRSLILDMDGVIIESAEIKTEAFRILFSKWPDKVDEMMVYHQKNMGISRYTKIRYFYESILREPYSNEIGEGMARCFSEMILEKVKQAPLVPGVQRLLEENKGRYQMFVASGTPHDELTEILHERGIKRFFTAFYGSPRTKVEIIGMILKKWKLKKDEVVFVGDGETDLRAAGMAGVHFVLRRTSENGHLLGDTVYSIPDFHSISDVIEAISADS